MKKIMLSLLLISIAFIGIGAVAASDANLGTDRPQFDYNYVAENQHFDTQNDVDYKFSIYSTSPLIGGGMDPLSPGFFDLGNKPYDPFSPVIPDLQ